ncbi:hypothetical protein A6E15_03560 [Natrinema saccharevitans]|uniref:Uncharacterized protein n=1 Tax=Natrinema saccharevitans TaxID=301967 RepID=A0A1S8ATT0_9EURY|nr:hypothetical protein [Natrinema saccharevitans]OLZ40110.1 hypothetical protein A6E15_03560 [Natrinema saccharevitans]
MSGRGRGAPRSSDITGAATQLKAAFVLLVGLSGGLVAFQGEASLVVIGAAILGGTVAGSALLWYLIWITTD